MLDIVQEGLKLHIQTHFALTVWNDFRTLKLECIQYDKAYYAQTRTQDRKKDWKGKGKKTQKAESSGVETNRLSTEEWEMCKVKGYCFICKKGRKEVLGLAKEHPNHPKRDTQKREGSQYTKKEEKKTSTPKKKSAGVKAMDMEQESDGKTEVSDSDSEDLPEGSKN